MLVARTRSDRLFRWDLTAGDPFRGDIRDPLLRQNYGTVLALAAGTAPGAGPVVVSASGDAGRGGDSQVSRWDPRLGAETGCTAMTC